MSERKSSEQISKRKTDSYESLKGSAQSKTNLHTGKPVDKTLFCRFEQKYLISESKAQAVSQFIKPYLQLDRYSKLRRGGSYPIVSLYLDSNDLQLCRESMTGQKNRFKLRIRSYTDEPEYPRFFEIKRRMNTIIIKSRARVMHHDVASLLSGLSLPSKSYDTDEEALKQFQLYVRSINAGPVIRIRYMRQAYEGDSDNRVRVTFDRELCYNVTRTVDISLNSPGWQRHTYTMGGVILEIKFTACYPAWLGRMVEYFNLCQTSISKYSTSIEEACELGFCAPQLLV